MTVRLGILGVVVGVAALANAAGIAATNPELQSGAVATGVHATEEFCKTMVKQTELFVEFMKLDPISPDMTKRAKYFEDQKTLNITLAKAAPPSLASDAAQSTKNANALNDAMQGRDNKAVTAATALITQPQHLAAAKRMSDYCGFKMAPAK